MKKKEFKLKKGDMVWARIPVNAMIISLNKTFGYTIRTDDGTEYSYYGDKDVDLLTKEDLAPSK